MEREHEAVAEVAEEPTDEAGHRHECAEPEHGRHEAEHRAHCIERLRAQPAGDDRVVDRPYLREKGVQIRGVSLVETSHLLLHALHVTQIVDVAPVVKVDAVERIERNEIDVVREPPAPGPKDRIDDVGRGDQARTHVEHVSGVLEPVCTSADPCPLLQKEDIEPRRLEPDGHAEPPETATDHDRFPLHRVLLALRIPNPPRRTLRVSEVWARRVRLS